MGTTCDLKQSDPTISVLLRRLEIEAAIGFELVRNRPTFLLDGLHTVRPETLPSFVCLGAAEAVKAAHIDWLCSVSLCVWGPTGVYHCGHIHGQHLDTGCLLKSDFLHFVMYYSANIKGFYALENIILKSIGYTEKIILQLTQCFAPLAVLYRRLLAMAMVKGHPYVGTGVWRAEPIKHIIDSAAQVQWLSTTLLPAVSVMRLHSACHLQRVRNSSATLAVPFGAG